MDVDTEPGPRIDTRSHPGFFNKNKIVFTNDYLRKDLAMIGNVLWIKICFGSNVVCVRLVRRHHHSTGVKKPEYLEEEKNAFLTPYIPLSICVNRSHSKEWGGVVGVMNYASDFCHLHNT